MSKFDPYTPYQLPVISKQQLKEAEQQCLDEIKRAHVSIAKIYGFLSGIPASSNALTHPIYLKEALESSEIEDINTTMLDVLQQQLTPGTSKTNSQLVVNYFMALLWGTEHVKQYGLTNRLVLGLHNQLLPQDPEGYRKVQVRIEDGRGAVRYTPPEAQNIPKLITQWGRLVNKDHSVDPLVVAAAGHYQFEAIHPFHDGNGRTGRMLMTLHLVHTGILNAPVVHISQYINAHRSEYYRLLRSATEDGDLNGFIKYLIKGFSVQADHSFTLLMRLQELQDAYQQRIRDKLPNIYSADLINQLFVSSVQTPVHLAKELGVHRETASKYLRKLSEAGFLDSTKSGRYMFYINSSMLNLLEKGGKLDVSNTDNNT